MKIYNITDKIPGPSYILPVFEVTKTYSYSGIDSKPHMKYKTLDIVLRFLLYRVGFRILYHPTNIKYPL